MFPLRPIITDVTRQPQHPGRSSAASSPSKSSVRLPEDASSRRRSASFNTRSLNGKNTLSQDAYVEIICHPGANEKDVSELMYFVRPTYMQGRWPKSKIGHFTSKQHDAMYALAGCSDICSVLSRVTKKARDAVEAVYGVSGADLITWFKNRTSAPHRKKSLHLQLQPLREQIDAGLLDQTQQEQQGSSQVNNGSLHPRMTLKLCSSSHAQRLAPLTKQADQSAIADQQASATGVQSTCVPHELEQHVSPFVMNNQDIVQQIYIQQQQNQQHLVQHQQSQTLMVVVPTLMIFRPVMVQAQNMSGQQQPKWQQQQQWQQQQHFASSSSTVPYQQLVIQQQPQHNFLQQQQQDHDGQHHDQRHLATVIMHLKEEDGSMRDVVVCPAGPTGTTDNSWNDQSQNSVHSNCSSLYQIRSSLGGPVQQGGLPPLPPLISYNIGGNISSMTQQTDITQIAPPFGSIFPAVPMVASSLATFKNLINMVGKTATSLNP